MKNVRLNIYISHDWQSMRNVAAPTGDAMKPTWQRIRVWSAPTLEEMLTALFLFLTGQPSRRCLRWRWSVWWGKSGALRASTCEMKPQSFVCHSPFTASFPSSTSFPRLSCVTPSYPEERQPVCQEEKGQANAAAMGYIRFQNKSMINVKRLYSFDEALDKGWGVSFKIQHTFLTCCL